MIWVSVPGKSISDLLNMETKYVRMHKPVKDAKKHYVFEMFISCHVLYEKSKNRTEAVCWSFKEVGRQADTGFLWHEQDSIEGKSNQIW